ncbi:MAG TPA: 2-oxoacid:acceptor oxidoreductase family protein [bacterium]|nr:2-oxoacid:acceptor oxidoreductase family protein [bacterium]HPT29742.1 2-oxoacid:acceptor oxidoreductase family protein [bacterium]
MWQIRLHGRGGQGVVTAAELIAIAAFHNGYESQAFPFFGVERSGAPIQAFARISQQPIQLREHIYQPNIIIVQDESLLSATDVLFGADNNTKLIINTKKTPTEMANRIKADKAQSFKIKAKNIYAVDATTIALDIFGRNLVNPIILAAFSRCTKIIDQEAIIKAIKEKFADKGPEVIKKNMAAITRAYAL